MLTGLIVRERAAARRSELMAAADAARLAHRARRSRRMVGPTEALRRGRLSASIQPAHD